MKMKSSLFALLCTLGAASSALANHYGGYAHCVPAAGVVCPSPLPVPAYPAAGQTCSTSGDYYNYVVRTDASGLVSVDVIDRYSNTYVLQGGRTNITWGQPGHHEVYGDVNGLSLEFVNGGVTIFHNDRAQHHNSFQLHQEYRRPYFCQCY